MKVAGFAWPEVVFVEKGVLASIDGVKRYLRFKYGMPVLVPFRLEGLPRR